MSYILNKILDKLQFSCTVETPYELKINTGFIDYSVIYSLANNAAERQSLINRGMEDALLSIRDFVNKDEDFTSSSQTLPNSSA